MIHMEFSRPSNYSVTSMFPYFEFKTHQVYEKCDIFSASLVHVTSTYDVSSVCKIYDFSFGDYKPLTELGGRLIEIRRKFILKNGKLLSPEEIDREIKLRRGGIHTSEQSKSIP